MTIAYGWQIPSHEATWAEQYYEAYRDALIHGPDTIIRFFQGVLPRFHQRFQRPHPVDPLDVVGHMEWQAYEILVCISPCSRVFMSDFRQYLRHVIHNTAYRLYRLEVVAGTADECELSAVDATPTRNKPVSRNTRERHFEAHERHFEVHPVRPRQTTRAVGKEKSKTVCLHVVDLVAGIGID